MGYGIQAVPIVVGAKRSIENFGTGNAALRTETAVCRDHDGRSQTS